jgi:hypothetical protein
MEDYETMSTADLFTQMLRQIFNNTNEDFKMRGVGDTSPFKWYMYGLFTNLGPTAEANSDKRNTLVQLVNLTDQYGLSIL